VYSLPRPVSENFSNSMRTTGQKRKRGKADNSPRKNLTRSTIPTELTLVVSQQWPCRELQIRQLAGLLSVCLLFTCPLRHMFLYEHISRQANLFRKNSPPCPLPLRSSSTARNQQGNHPSCKRSLPHTPSITPSPTPQLSR
jgi:hypothetical protein